MWPESNPKKARSSLNSAIYTLRKQLGSYTPEGAIDYVIFEDGYYRLNPSIEVITDSDEFEAHYGQGKRLQKKGEGVEAVAEYEKAVELYRDDYLVEDLYEDWTMAERERLSNAYVGVLNLIAVYYYEVGRYQESIRACHLILAKDRCHEGSYRLLAQCYVHLGFLDTAWHQYELFRRLWRSRFDSDISLQSRHAFEELFRATEVS
jgi:two-component SAPR family response regulator